MTFTAMLERANGIRDTYAELNRVQGREQWTATEYAQAFVGDVGQLMKLLMMKKNLRKPVDALDQKIEHELGDCLWALMMIAGDLNIDLERSFNLTMDELGERLAKT